MRRLALMWTLYFLIGQHISHCLCIHDKLTGLDHHKAVFDVFMLFLPQSYLDCVWSYIVIMQLSVFLCSALKPSFVFPFVVFRS